MSMKKMLAVVAAASLVAVAAPAFANPFSDVPEGHWAYDAVEELSAKGIIDGYPDGTFKGTKAMTRYEIATVIAKAIANAGDEDIEQLKALVVEFGPELEALGVKVDGFDARLAKLEKGLSGWKLSGDFRLDYKAFDYDNPEAHGDNSGNTRDGFTSTRARIYMHRDMDNGLSFDARLHGGKIDQYWLTAKDLFGVAGLSTKLGTFWIDWDDEDGMYTGGSSGGDSTFLDLNLRGAELRYSTGAFEITGFAASNWESSLTSTGVYSANESGDYYGIRAKVNFGERAWLSANYISTSSDSQDADFAFDTFWVSAGVKIVDGLNIKAAYYMQDIDLIGGVAPSDYGFDDDPQSYKIILEASQDLLKFTSLWIEYNHYDQGFSGMTPRYYFDWSKGINSARLPAFAVDDWNEVFATDVEYFYVFLKQQWTSKWSTYIELEYADADDYGTYGDDMTRCAIGVGYQYTPALYFELAYSMQDGDCVKDSDYEDNVLRFRTQFFF